MKKKVTIVAVLIFLFMLLVLRFPKGGEAVVSGDCEVCHSLYPGMMEAAAPGKPLRYVLQNSMCVSCHSNAERDTIKTLGGARVPVVYSRVEPDRPLSGGNFYYVKVFGDRRGHNVDGIAAVDTKNMFMPPGYDRFSDPSTVGFNDKKPLACAGSNGCHGDRNVENPFAAILGTHHSEDFPVDGSTTARSYRFLKRTANVKGVTGLEDKDWGYTASSKEHNEYTPSINRLCADCHSGLYRRDEIGKASPWFRHPTGIVLPKRGEYMSYNPDVPPPADSSGIRIYSLDAPVARPAVPAVSSEVVRPGTDIVMCLSCHVAHGSPNEFMLRWNYDSIVSGEEGSTGCFICHTGKGE